MKIIVISPPYRIQEEEEIVTSLFENGLASFHLRKPNARLSEIKQFLEAIPAKYHNRILLHSYHGLARRFELQGIHYTSSHLKPGFKNWWLTKRLASYGQNLERTCTYKKLAAFHEKSEIPFDYVFLTPVFHPGTGQLHSDLSRNTIQAAIEKSGKKIVAMGGIDIERIQEVQELGFSGMALNNCLWSKVNPVDEFCKIRTRCQELGLYIE